MRADTGWVVGSSSMDFRTLGRICTTSASPWDGVLRGRAGVQVCLGVRDTATEAARPGLGVVGTSGLLLSEIFCSQLARRAERGLSDGGLAAVLGVSAPLMVTWLHCWGALDSFGASAPEVRLDLEEAGDLTGDTRAVRSVYGWKGLGELLKPTLLPDRTGEFLVKSLVSDDAGVVVVCWVAVLLTVLLTVVDEGGSGARLFFGELTCAGAGVSVALGGCHRGFFSSSFLPLVRQGIISEPRQCCSLLSKKVLPSQ